MSGGFLLNTSVLFCSVTSLPRSIARLSARRGRLGQMSRPDGSDTDGPLSVCGRRRSGHVDRIISRNFGEGTRPQGRRVGLMNVPYEMNTDQTMSCMTNTGSHPDYET